jgi:hypothetical protein
MTRSGSGTSGDPDIYVIPPKAGQVYCELEFAADCIVLFQNSGSNYSRLDWTWGVTTSAVYILDFAANSHATIEAGFIFDGDTAGTHQGYFHFRGELSAVGTSGNEIVFKNFRSVYIYPYRYNQTWDYVKMMEVTISTGYVPYINFPQTGVGKATLSMKHITIANSTAINYGRLQFTDLATPRDDYIFEDWDIDNIDYILYMLGSSVKLVRFTFNNSSGTAYVYCSGNAAGIPVETVKYDLTNHKTLQPSVVFEDCTWNDTKPYTSPAPPSFERSD